MAVLDRFYCNTVYFSYCCVFRLLEKVYNLDEAAPHSLDPYSDDNKAPFYRQPAGLRRAKKHDEKEELGNEILL